MCSEISFRKVVHDQYKLQEDRMAFSCTCTHHALYTPNTCSKWVFPTSSTYAIGNNKQHPQPLQHMPPQRLEKTRQAWAQMYHHKLTEVPDVTIPWSWTTFGCRNCPIMAASCSSFTLSSTSVWPPGVLLMATSISFDLVFQYAFATLPNSPFPIWPIILC